MSNQEFNPQRPIDLHGPNEHLRQDPPTDPSPEPGPEPTPAEVDKDPLKADPEIEAMESIRRALIPLNSDARRRVLEWTTDRFLKSR